jgi:hypothetical protein
MPARKTTKQGPANARTTSRSRSPSRSPGHSESPCAEGYKQVKVESEEEENFEGALASEETAASGSAEVSGSVEASGSVEKSKGYANIRFHIFYSCLPYLSINNTN